jgi:hypothetical protein
MCSRSIQVSGIFEFQGEFFDLADKFEKISDSLKEWRVGWALQQWHGRLHHSFQRKLLIVCDITRHRSELNRRESHKGRPLSTWWHIIFQENPRKGETRGEMQSDSGTQRWTQFVIVVFSYCFVLDSEMIGVVSIKFWLSLAEIGEAKASFHHSRRDYRFANLVSFYHDSGSFSDRDALIPQPQFSLHQDESSKSKNPAWMW